MDQLFFLKSFSIFLVVLISLTFILFAFGFINLTWFWIITAICAFNAWIVVPNLRKRLE